MENSKSNIFCPNCGSNNKIEQNFCRFCSFHLLETTNSLTAQLSSGKNAGQLKKLEWIKKLSDLSSNGLLYSAIFSVLIYLYTVLTKTTYPGVKVFYALLGTFIVIESIMLYFRRTNTLGYAEEMERKKSLLQNELTARKTGKLLQDKPFEPLASVTENSTRLLFVENKTNKLE